MMSEPRGDSPPEVSTDDGERLYVTRTEAGKRLVVLGRGEAYSSLAGEEVVLDGQPAKLCALNGTNAMICREILPFARPCALGKEGVSLGLGDRLGLAAPGHLQVVQRYAVKPVLAQQSMRELRLTNRTYRDVLDAATWGVIESGYQAGYGADGDHLKEKQHIRDALTEGFSMITLDCTDHIDDQISGMAKEEVDAKYESVVPSKREALEELYLNRSFRLASGEEICFPETEFRRCVLVYQPMLEFVKDVYQEIIAPHGRAVDFEISIDETGTPTSPLAHYFVAAELRRRRIACNSIAPRFCGEFQKGIDYIGDLEQFQREFSLHARIADHFGHKLSIHSGSDKFAVYPIIGRYTRGRVHVKTAGTSWLEAIRVIAKVEPQLYRQVHQCAVTWFPEAQKIYHVKAQLANVPSLDSLTDSQLPDLMEQDDARQLIHITYGYILRELGDRLYQVWRANEASYAAELRRHIGKHVTELGLQEITKGEAQ